MAKKTLFYILATIQVPSDVVPADKVPFGKDKHVAGLLFMFRICFLQFGTLTVPLDRTYAD